MKFDNLLTDEAILKEFGDRLARRRINHGMTQAALSREAGVSKRTVERIEAGASAQMVSVVRVLRVLELLRNFDRLLPEETTRPMELLRQQKQARKRATSPVRPTTEWTWDEDA